MISYCESLLPWHLSFRLRAVIDYLQCDMLHLCFVSKEKVSLVPVPINCSEQYSQLFKDKNYYKHPNLYLESMNLLPHHISEVDKFLLRAEKDRVWGNKLSDHQVYGKGGNSLSIVRKIKDETFLCLTITYLKGYMIKHLFSNKLKTKKALDEIIYHTQKDLDLLEAFSYNRKDFNHQVAEFDQQALKFFQKEQPNLTIKQHYFAKYLSQADDFSTNAIANALSLSPRTVADYFMFLKDKFHAKDKISTIIKCREYFELLWE